MRIAKWFGAHVMTAFGIGARCILLVTCILSSAAQAAIKVSDVEVFSGSPWKEVLVRYTITGKDDEADFIRLTATDKAANKSYTVETGSSALTGAELSEGRHLMRWNAASEGVKFSSANVVFSVSVVSYGGVQLWANGPYWAECNVGATKPEEYGYYFWWGDTVGYKYNGSRWDAVDGSRTGFTFGSANCPTYGKIDATLNAYGYTDAAGNLVSKYDAATQHLGAPWRMPTDAEFDALKSNCMTTWTTRNGVNGRLVTGKGAYASKSIFLPAAGYGGSRLSYLGSDGYYWSSTPLSDYSTCAWNLYFDSSNFDRNYDSRYYGHSVRPLRGFAK